ncbi:P2Y purinoceptor 13-like [Hoplias malabaricus]|uniref:P2Y purinoceptor 13-like n=1 Tax=Hoplias malabaricus TaxID=27720 RepID=UPI003461832C
METQNATNPVCEIDNDARGTAVSTLYFLLFVPALLLNLIVAWISTHLKSKSTFMVYLKHLVAADLLMTLTFPLRAASEMPNVSEALLAFACRYSSVIFYLAMNVSIVLMGLISLDRFFKIVRPGGRLLCQNLLFSKILSVIVWVLIISSNTIPVIVTTDQDPTNKTDSEFCMRMKSDTGKSWHKGVVLFAIFNFWIMCGLIMFSYTCITKKIVESYRRSNSHNNKGKRKAKVRVFLILAVFLICYAPYYIIRTPYTNLQISTKDNTKAETKSMVSCTQPMKVIKDLTLWLSALNVCMDPLIYFFLCNAFRRKFMELFSLNRFFPFLAKSTEPSQSSDTSM